MQSRAGRLKAIKNQINPLIGYPSLDINFAAVNEILDPRITFSRTSNATLVGPDGLIQYAPHNLLTYSGQFDNATWSKNASIVITANANTAPDGTMTADEFSGSLVNCGVWRVLTVTASIPHIYSIYLKNVNNATNLLVGCDANPANAFIRFNSVTGEITSVTSNVTSSSVIAIGNGWYRVTVGFVPTTTLPTFVLYSTSGASATWLVWGAQLNEGALQPYYSTTVKNLLGYSQNFENAAWTKSNSSIDVTPVMGPLGFDGGQKLVENTVNAAHGVNIDVTALPTTRYTVSSYIKAGERTWARIALIDNLGADGGRAWFDLVNGVVGNVDVQGAGSNITASIVAVGNGWYRCSVSGQMNNSKTTLTSQIRLARSNGDISYTGDGTSGIYIFGAQLSDSASLDPYSYNPVAAPTSTAYYGPRFDYDPATLAPKGLLIEEQRTNLLTYSSEFDNATWLKTTTTVAANSIISPDGTNTADTITATGADSSIRESVSGISAGATYTFSVYLKSDVPTSLSIYIVDSGGGSGNTSQTVNVTNQWQRFNVIRTTSALTTSVSCQIGGATSFSTGESVYIWGAQLEAGAFPTSYIPTTSATVTRAADNASMVGSNFSSWYDQSEGTIYSQWILGGDNTSANVYNINDTTIANYIRNRYNSAGTANDNAVAVSNIVQQTLIATNQVALYAMYKNAMAYKQNDFARSANGTLTSGSTGNIPVVSQMNIGGIVGDYLNGHIQSIKYYPTRLPNGTLQGLTA